MIFAGEQVDPQLYNDRLFKDGAGLLPARLEKASDEPVTGMVVESLDDSPLATLEQDRPGGAGPRRREAVHARRAAAASARRKLADDAGLRTAGTSACWRGGTIPRAGPR